jgi:hypothetical protein
MGHGAGAEQLQEAPRNELLGSQLRLDGVVCRLITRPGVAVGRLAIRGWISDGPGQGTGGAESPCRPVARTVELLARLAQEAEEEEEL